MELKEQATSSSLLSPFSISLLLLSILIFTYNSLSLIQNMCDLSPKRKTQSPASCSDCMDDKCSSSYIAPLTRGGFLEVVGLE